MAELPALPYEDIASRLRASPSVTELYMAIANVPFVYAAEMAYIFLGFITLMVVDEAEQTLRLVGWSDTEHYHMAVASYPFDPAEFTIALSDTVNDFVKVVQSGKPLTPTSWTSVQRPTADDQMTELNQVSSGITHFSIYPLGSPLQGTLMYNFYDFDRDGELRAAQLSFMQQYTQVVTEIVVTYNAEP